MLSLEELILVISRKWRLERRLKFGFPNSIYTTHTVTDNSREEHCTSAFSQTPQEISKVTTDYKKTFAV